MPLRKPIAFTVRRWPGKIGGHGDIGRFDQDSSPL